jgi:hypothetical protein
VRNVTALGSGFSSYAPRGSALIEFNDFFIPDDYRTDCKGNRVSGGPCQCGEFGIGLKSGNAVVRHNRISGYRQADAICGGSGTPGAGIDPAACASHQHCPSTGVVIEENVISDSHVGIYLGPQARGIRISANLLCQNEIGISDGFADSGTIISDNAFYGNGTDYHRYGHTVAVYTGSRKASAESCPSSTRQR